jgi:hypothetical protein
MDIDDTQITQEDLDRFDRHQEKYLHLRQALRLPSIYTSGEIGNRKLDQKEIHGVVQKEYGVTNSTSSIPVIGTWGLATCVAVVAYDANTKTAGIAHVDSSKSINSLANFLNDVTGSESELSQIEVGLLGGEELSKDLINETIIFLLNKGVSLKYAEIMDRPHPNAFVIDSRDGKIYPNIVPENCGENLDSRYNDLLSRSDLLKSFDGRDVR